MSRYKVLELPLYAQWTEMLEHDTMQGYHKRTDIVFHRDGLYLDRYTRQCWLEYDNGTKAIEYSRIQFLYELKLMTVPRLSVDDRWSIITLKHSHLCSKELWDMYLFDDERRQIESSGIEGKRSAMRFNKRFQEFKLKLANS